MRNLYIVYRFVRLKKGVQATVLPGALFNSPKRERPEPCISLGHHWEGHAVIGHCGAAGVTASAAAASAKLEEQV